VSRQKREEEENTAGVSYTLAICAFSTSPSLCHVEKGWVVWLPRCVRKEETKEKSERTLYVRGVSHLWFAAVNTMNATPCRVSHVRLVEEGKRGVRP
jgi:hypothetical protein